MANCSLGRPLLDDTQSQPQGRNLIVAVADDGGLRKIGQRFRRFTLVVSKPTDEKSGVVGMMGCRMRNHRLKVRLRESRPLGEVRHEAAKRLSVVEIGIDTQISQHAGELHRLVSILTI